MVNRALVMWFIIVEDRFHSMLGYLSFKVSESDHFAMVAVTLSKIVFLSRLLLLLLLLFI